MSNWIAGIAAAALGLLALDASAEPLKIRVSDGVSTITITDDGAGDSLGGQPNAIKFVGSIGSYQTNVSTGLASPGPLSFPQLLDLDSTNTGSGLLRIELFKTFDATSQPISSLVGEISGTLGGNSAADLLFEILVNNVLVGSQSFLSTAAQGDNAFSSTETDLVNITGEYLLTLRVTMNHSCTTASCGTTSFDASIATVVPEPATLALFGAGLLGIGLARRRPSRTSVALLTRSSVFGSR